MSSVELRVTFKRVAIVLCLLPLISLISCIALVILLHWEETTATHCRVSNYLPSLSAAIGNNAPEKYIWRIGIALHCTPRLLIPFMYYKMFTQFGLPRIASFVMSIGCLLHFIENWCLIFLSYVSSIDDYEIHKINFIGFICCSMIYMMINSLIMKIYGKKEICDRIEKSLQLKLMFLMCYILVFAMAVYFFWRHNAYCEPGMYSMFGLGEYLTVLFNIAFHSTAILDFSGAEYSIGPLIKMKKE